MRAISVYVRRRACDAVFVDGLSTALSPPTAATEAGRSRTITREHARSRGA